MFRSQIVFLLMIAGGTCLACGILWGTSLPLGVPGQWTWPRIPNDQWSAWGPVLTLLPFLVVLGTLHFGRIRLVSCPGWEKSLWLLGLTVLAFFMQFSLIQSATGIFGLQRIPLVLYYPMTEGYFLEAKKHPEPVQDYLRSYPETLKKGDYLHLGTHPPGLILMNRWLLSSCENSPALQKIIAATMPEDIKLANEFLRESSAQLPPQQAGQPASQLLPLTSADSDALWLRALFSAVGIACLVPLIYGMVLPVTGSVAAWNISALAMFVPGIIVFFPKSDVLYAVMSLVVICCWNHALNRNNLLTALMTGLLLASSMFFSLALLPIGIVLVVWTGLVLYFSRKSIVTQAETSPSDFKLSWITIVAAGVGFLVLPFLLAITTQINLFEIWQLNLQNHARFYAHNDRTYWAWLIMNVGEMTLLLGVPALVLSLSGFKQAWNLTTLSAHESKPTFIMQMLVLAVYAVWILLWLSGKNMGEAMRLWIFWSPLFLLVISLSSAVRFSHRFWTSVLVLQYIICIVTASTIDGFGFTSFLAR
jgi:hypothetical protein